MAHSRDRAHGHRWCSHTGHICSGKAHWHELIMILLDLISWEHQALAPCRDCHAELSKERKLDTNK